MRRAVRRRGGGRGRRFNDTAGRDCARRRRERRSRYRPCMALRAQRGRRQPVRGPAGSSSSSQGFSSLTRRIVFLNIAGLLAFVIGILYLTQFRAGLIDARVQSLIVQADNIAERDRRSARGPTMMPSTSIRSACWNCRPAKATRRRTMRCSASSFRSIPSASRRCCAACSRRPIRGRVSTTATAP